jgi:hypothetical protein
MDRLRAPLAVAAAALALALVASACMTSTAYVSSSSQGMYFKIPNGWHTYSQTNLKRQGLISASLPYLMAFDADPKPDVNHLLDSATYPWGLAEVDGISTTDRLNFSLDSLLNTIVPVDQLQGSSGNSVSQLTPSKVITRGTLRGVQVSLKVTISGRAPLSYTQISLVNTPTTKTWVLILGCSPQCFAQHRGDIDRVINSWIVKARQT